MTVIRNLERKACQNVLQIICLASIFALQCSKEFLATQRKRLAANLKVVLASLARVVSSIQHGDARIQSPFLVWNKLRSVQRRANRSRPVRILRQHAHPSSLALSKLLGPFRVDRADSRRGDDDGRYLSVAARRVVQCGRAHRKCAHRVQLRTAPSKTKPALQIVSWLSRHRLRVLACGDAPPAVPAATEAAACNNALHTTCKGRSWRRRRSLERSNPHHEQTFDTAHIPSCGHPMRPNIQAGTCLGGRSSALI